MSDYPSTVFQFIVSSALPPDLKFAQIVAEAGEVLKLTKVQKVSMLRYLVGRAESEPEKEP